MGCDIHTIAEVRNNKTGKWEKVGDYFSLNDSDKEFYRKEKTDSPFNWRSYVLYGFLADVRNYSYCEPISKPKGLPDDSEFLNKKIHDDYLGEFTMKQNLLDDTYHSFSYLTLKELLDFDYDKEFWNRRITKEVSPGFFMVMLLLVWVKGKLLHIEII